ncbi:MAG TPA: glycosyltransferase [Thermoplasmata archaeon]|nr:glycosyltransferase [Thermoplasmata archaeon]
MTGDRRDPGLTVLQYSQDSKGLGHVRRNLTIARQLLAAYPDAVTFIATESPVVDGFALPDRCDYIKLPRRLIRSGVAETHDEANTEKNHFRDVRARMLREAVLGLAPDLVLVDHEPLGYRGELREGLLALKDRYPDTKFVFGCRDIMDDPEHIRAKWQEMGVYDAFENLYDGIAVYGSRSLYDVGDAYDIPPSLRSKLHYCGFIVRPPPSADPVAVRFHYGFPATGPLVVATVGSGIDGYPVLEATEAAVDRLRMKFPDLRAVLVSGPFMPEEQQSKLRERATAAVRIVPRADTMQLMACADAIVSMGGYNGVYEALAVGRPLVIVPRCTHKVEQRIRAESLAAHDLARWIHPDSLTGRRLAEDLDWALSCNRDDYARHVRETIPSFDGAANLTSYLGRWLGPAPASEEGSGEHPASVVHPA